MLAAFIPVLAKQPDATVVNVSELAFVPHPVSRTYSATKAAVHSFTEGLRVQLADTSIRCSNS